MIDDLVKDYLPGQLRSTRQALVWKLDGLSEYDVRRPLTATGTNPFPEPLGRWQDADGSDPWMIPAETRGQIIDFYRRASGHADATINELPMHARGHVPWWSRPDVKLLNIMVHVLQETTRHAGHADVLREQLDGRTGLRAEYEEQIDTTARQAHWAHDRAGCAGSGQRLASCRPIRHAWRDGDAVRNADLVEARR